MAQVTPIVSQLQFQLQTGTAADGTPKLSVKTYNNVDSSATDDDVLAVGQALGALFAQPVVQVIRINQSALSTATA